MIKRPKKYSVFSLVKNALSYHENWQPVWRNPEIKKEYDAIVLSLAGLKMLSLEKEVKEIFSDKQMLPAVGQGAIALQCRTTDKKTLNIS